MHKDVSRFAIFINEETKKLELNSLPYSKNSLQPIMSRRTIEYHYDHLAKGYVDRFNKGEGDPKFNEAGAFLHNIFFPQLQPPNPDNKPTGAVAKLIKDKFKTFPRFKKAFEDVAMKIQGSGWVYLSTSGTINTISNHIIKRDIALLVDWWEHAWALDYQSDKKKYLENIWQIINWDDVNTRL